MGADGLDPIEPPPQGDVELIDVRRQAGEQMVLFGNLEVADIENLSPPRVREKVVQALREGTAGPGRGFVLMPSASPYGRTITPTGLANYQTMVRPSHRVERLSTFTMLASPRTPSSSPSHTVLDVCWVIV